MGIFVHILSSSFTMIYAIESYDLIRTLIEQKDYTLAENKLKAMTSNADDAEWHFLYSFVMLHKAWFDSAKAHLEKAIILAPEHMEYSEFLAKLIHRNRNYSDPYYNTPHYRRRSGCCCCCDDCCCQFDCCDLICLDSCCECMGGDLISCI